MGTGICRRLAVVCFCLLSCALSASVAAAVRVAKGSAPSWVSPVAVDLAAAHPTGKTAKGVYYLLSDEQTRLEPQGKSVYRHLATRAIEQQGVEAVAHVSFDFDPTFQTARLNMLRVHRAGAVQDRLPGAPIKLLQRERDLESRIYDGSQTADITLDDIRPGDVVEYAYTVEGSNPVLGANEYGRFSLQWSVPLEFVRRRLLAPSSTRLEWRSHGGALPPEIKRAGDQTEYIWAAKQVTGISVPGDTPSWWNPYARIEWSTYADWASVARWAEALYATPPIEDANLRREVERIAREAPGPQERISAVLDFVQSDIRYLGIEIGPGSFAPRSPDTVFQRRFGDCKDKVSLAIAMLRELGVQAYPALVSTQLRSSVNERLPMPGVFNHVVFVARAGDRQWWLDPTRPPQKASLEQVGQANYGKALVLDGKSTSLTEIPVASASVLKKLVAVRIDASKGFGSTAPVDVVTRFEGVAAERMREELRSRNLDELQLDYQNWYAKDYRGLKRVTPITVADNLGLNRVTTHEHYELPTLIRRDHNDQDVIWLYARDMKSLLYAPTDSERSSPLSIRHPEETRVVLTVLLPDDRVIKSKPSTISDAAFEFHGRESQAGREIKMDYIFRTLSDHVKPAELPTHIANLESARNKVGYTLRPKPSARSADASPMGTWSFFALVAVAALMGVVITLFAKLTARLMRRIQIGWQDAGMYAFNCVLFGAIAAVVVADLPLREWSFWLAVLVVPALLGTWLFRARAKSPEGEPLGIWKSTVLSVVALALSASILVLGNAAIPLEALYSLAGSGDRQAARAQAEKAHLEAISKVKLEGLDRPLRGLSLPQPELPAAAQKPENTGSVEVEFFVETDGSVRDVNVVGTAHSMLAEASKQAVRRWKFEPPVFQGKPIRKMLSQEFVFLVK